MATASKVRITLFLRVMAFAENSVRLIAEDVCLLCSSEDKK